MCLGPLAARRAEATLCPTRGRNGARHARVHAVPACGARRSPAVSGASKGWRWWEGRVRSGAESPDDRLLNLERRGEHVGRGAAPPPRVTRPIWWETSCAYATGNAAQNPGPAATTATTRWGWGRDTQPFGSRDKDKTKNEMCTHVRAHTCTHAHTRRVLNQAAAGLTGQQRRRRQKERASEPEAPGRVAGGGGERRRGVWTRRGPRDVSRSVASTWHQPVGNWRRALF